MTEYIKINRPKALYRIITMIWKQHAPLVLVPAEHV